MKGVTTALLALFLFGCAGGLTAKPAPDWISVPPQPDANYFYFTGAGTSRENDQAVAEQTARGVVMDEIMRYIGVKVTAETEAVAVASVNSFKTDVMQAITQTGSGRISGLQISDKYVETSKSGTTVYLLARYNKTDLAKEKKRIEDLFIEQQQAVSGPEAEAGELESAGNYYGAAIKHIQAAAAAATSGLDNAKIKFERNINGAKDALDKVALVKMNDNLTTAVGTPFADPFTLKVVAGSTAKDPGIPEVALKATYTEIRNDRKQVKTASIKTDAAGVAAFTYPVPQFVGPEKLTMSIDFGAYLDTLDSLPKEYAGMVGALEDIVVAKKAVFTLSTFSAARTLETGIAVAALDDSGSPIPGSDFASGIMKALSDARFSVKLLALDAAGLADKADSDAVAAVSQAAGAKMTRAIFGSAQSAGSESDAGQVFVKVSGTVKVADLKTGAILLTVTKNKSALGKTEAAALKAALQQLGRDIGQDIANKLR